MKQTSQKKKNLPKSSTTRMMTIIQKMKSLTTRTAMMTYGNNSTQSMRWSRGEQPG
ncbi:hypothetical protein RSOL_005820 [Rhizoctonia solani AG-3 Rhs1AP]|uniref:Uncharacterized protein n=1 Tax=Rhizoctonia solani AG-3 Rhs1AP TaxID=1086054 RepID=X8IUQ2_9AGAM|nr:hypothetical protein RSOL_005820 [Rhizoctonia solani AG-3 Rhs1AP]